MDGRARRESRPVRIGDIVVGGGWPVVIQSMTTTTAEDLEGSLAQIASLVAQGCMLIRLAVPSPRAAAALEPLRARVARRWPGVALVADVHFHPRLAFEAAPFVDKVRVNPGNFAPDAREAEGRLAELLPWLARHGTALRVGVNQGSLPPYVTEVHGAGPTGMAAAAIEYLRVCCVREFFAVVVSLKSSNPAVMVAANRLLAAWMANEGIAAPLHLGVTEAGEGIEGELRSGVGIATLLLDGLGDTIRVSLTGEPAAEIPVCRRILEGVERAGGLGGSARAGGPTGRPGEQDRFAEARESSWGPVRLGGSHPPRIELVVSIAGNTPESSGLPSPAAAMAAPGAPLPVESLVLRMPAEAGPGWKRAFEEWRAHAAAQGVPWWLEVSSPDAIRSLSDLEGSAGFVIRVSLEQRRARAEDMVAGANEPPSRNDRPPRRPTDLDSTFTHLAARAREGHAGLRWHLDLPGEQRETASFSMVDEAVSLALDLVRASREAGLEPAALSCSGAMQAAFLRKLARAWPGAVARPPFVATVPSDPWQAAAACGSLLLDHLVEALRVEAAGAASPLLLAAGLLQATRRRLSRAEFLSCPGCGRLPFDLAPTVRRLKKRFGHLSDVKIAIMGCSVNGPGEMADADFGYVGAGAGKVDLYAGGRRLHGGLTPEAADEALADLLRKRGHAV